MVLNDLVLKKIKDVVRSLTNTRWRVSQKWIIKMMGCYLGGSYSRASNGILVQETETLPTFKKIKKLKWYGQCSTTLQILIFLHFLIPLAPRSLSLFAQNTEPGDIVLKITNILLMQWNKAEFKLITAVLLITMTYKWERKIFSAFMCNTKDVVIFRKTVYQKVNTTFSSEVIR